MRWLYFNRNNPVESSEHAEMLAKIDAWWKAFAYQADRLDQLFKGKVKWDLPAWMEDQLQAISPELMWEFGPAIRGKGHRLIITPEASHHLRPLANEVVARAPAIEGWEFYSWRIAEGMNMLAPTVEGRVDLDVHGVTVAVSAGDDHRIDLVYQWPEYPDDEQQAMHGAFVISETLLGEEMLEKWVGVLESVPCDRAAVPGQRFLPLERLNEVFHAIRESIVDQLPPRAFSTDEDGTWALLSLEPRRAEDYPGRSDLMTCVTCNQGLTTATLSTAVFASERFSRSGEIFCYVKIDGSLSDGSAGGLPMIFEDREEIEQAVEAALSRDGIGGLIGGGSGLRYSYVELAITDLKRAIPAIRQVLREGRVPERSWILFHDTSLCGEWIGIYDDSPSPPLRIRDTGDDEQDDSSEIERDVDDDLDFDVE